MFKAKSLSILRDHHRGLSRIIASLITKDDVLSNPTRRQQSAKAAANATIFCHAWMLNPAQGSRGGDATLSLCNMQRTKPHHHQ